jgi:hypothetical protein
LQLKSAQPQTPQTGSLGRAASPRWRCHPQQQSSCAPAQQTTAQQTG